MAYNTQKLEAVYTQHVIFSPLVGYRDFLSTSKESPLNKYLSSTVIPALSGNPPLEKVMSRV